MNLVLAYITGVILAFWFWAFLLYGLERDLGKHGGLLLIMALLWPLSVLSIGLVFVFGFTSAALTFWRRAIAARRIRRHAHRCLDQYLNDRMTWPECVDEFDRLMGGGR